MTPAAVTRRLYAFESDPVLRVPSLYASRPMPWLRARAHVVATREAGHRPPPVVAAGPGLPSGSGVLVSYERAGRIELARQQRNLGVLLHELAHWLTPRTRLDHGPTFCRTYFYLLAEYGGINPILVTAAAIERGIKL